MIQRFGVFTTNIACAYKDIQWIKNHHMNKIGLKGTHVVCLNLLYNNPDGLTAAEICTLSKEDKSGISRILSELEQKGYISYETFGDKRKYRAKAILTDTGKEYAEKVNSLIVEAVDVIGRNLSEEERTTFYRVLEIVAQNLDNYCTELSERTNENE